MRIALTLPVAVLVTLPSAALGQVAPCAGVPGFDDRCESWSAIYDDPITAVGSYQLEPRVAASEDGRRLFVSAINQRKNLADPGNSPASWTVLGYDGETGAERWQRTFQGSGNYDRPNAIIASRDGSLVVATGGSYNAPLFTSTDRDLMTIAYDGETGAERWRAHSPGPVKDVGASALLSADESQVFIMVNDAGANGDIDAAIAAYDAADGSLLWRTPYRGLAIGKVDSPKSIALSPTGDLIYLAVESGATADFDADYAVVAYATGGATPGAKVWEARYDAAQQRSDRVSDVAVDVAGRVIVTGDSLRDTGGVGTELDYATVAYDGRDGRKLWAKRYAGPAGVGLHFGRTIATSPGAPVVVVSGQSQETKGDNDWATVAYDSATGAELWVRRLSTPRATTEFANDMVVSPDGSAVVIAGVSGGGNPTNYRDLNRSSGITTAYSIADGTQEWVARLTGDDETDSFSPRAVVVGTDNSAFTVGQLTNNLQTDESDNLYDSMLVAYRAATEPTPVVPEAPYAVLVPLVAMGVAGALLTRRRAHARRAF